MAAKKRADPREAEYLASEDATGLWARIRNETRFNRRVAEEPKPGDRYNRRLLYLMAAAVFRTVQRLVPYRGWRRMLDAIEAYADGEATFRSSRSESASDYRMRLEDLLGSLGVIENRYAVRIPKEMHGLTEKNGAAHAVADADVRQS